MSHLLVKFVLILAILFNITYADDPCYAPPNFYGGACQSSKSFISSCYNYIRYSVDVVGDTNVFCQALGTGQYQGGSPCTFGWYDIGIVNTGSYILGWSSTAGTPAIRCKGTPLGSALTWSWSSGTGNLYCPLYCSGSTCNAEANGAPELRGKGALETDTLDDNDFLNRACINQNENSADHTIPVQEV